jgi:hypothetical protein
MRAAGIGAHVVAAWHGHTERMTQAVYGRVTDDRLSAGSAVSRGNDAALSYPSGPDDLASARSRAARATGECSK